VDKTPPQDVSNTNDTTTAGISDITEDSDPACYLDHAFNYPFSNIQLKFSTRKEIASIIKSLKPKNACGYDAISIKLLKISSAYITLHYI
jgi:hypothetical protein